MAEILISREDRAFYVYVIFHPDGRPCYVGKGCGDRWKRHIRCSHNKHLHRISKEADHKLPVVKIQEGLTATEAFEIEKALILAIGRNDFGTGPLVNHSDGGDGMSNPSPEFRAAVSKRFKGKTLSDNHRGLISRALKGRLDGNDVGRRASPIAHLGEPLSREIVEKMRKSKTGVPRNPEDVRKQAERQRGRKLSAEHRAAISKGNKGIPRPTPPGVAIRIAATMKAKRLKWWCSQDGHSYRSPRPLNASDVRGRKLKG